LGFAIGPTGGLVIAPNSDYPYLTIGGVVTPDTEVGPSGAVLIAQGSPSEGPTVSVSHFNKKGEGGEVDFTPNGSGGISTTVDGGYGVPGTSAAFTLTVNVGTIANLGGPFEYDTTPMTSLSTSNTESSPSILPKFSPPSVSSTKTASNNSSGNTSSYTSASTYLSEASQAINAGNYTAAINYLSKASSAL